MDIDLTQKISKHFTWKEALWLRQWGRAAGVGDGLTFDVMHNLMGIFFAMDEVRDYFNSPIIVHDAYRPKEYNEERGGSKNSAHMCLEEGVAAVDFHVAGFSCDDVRKKIIDNGMLELWMLRMEDRPGSDWIHLDSRPVKPGGARYFLP